MIIGSMVPHAAMATPTSPIEPVSIGRQLAALQPPSTSPGNDGSPVLALRSNVAEARHILTAIQAFVEEATRLARLDEQLQTRRLDNDRLRLSLRSQQTARDAAETHARPSETLVSALTKTVVGNWLETVRLRERSEGALDELSTSERSWRQLRQRVDALKRDLSARRSEIRALRAERAAMTVELGRMRREIDKTTAVTLALESDHDRLSTMNKALRHDIAAFLRMILLESEGR